MNSAKQENIVNSEIRALLMLLLLKGGTRAEEIQTALQMAALSRITASDGDMEIEEADADIPAPPPAQVDPMIKNRVRQLSPKQVVRNTYLAPIKGYAA